MSTVAIPIVSGIFLMSALISFVVSKKNGKKDNDFNIYS
jgi:hypothetical protein